MASLKQIRRRIVGVQNTRQITRAMKMVAAARMRKAQENMEAARPYSSKLREVIASLVARTESDVHPLLISKDPKEIGIICVTSDRGLAGGFNATICRRTDLLLQENSDKEVELLTIGRKGNDFFKNRGAKIHKYYADVFKDMEFNSAVSIGKEISSYYIAGSFDRIYVVFNEFKNAMQQNLISERLLPITSSEALSAWNAVDYIYEPDANTVLDAILPLYINVQVWRILLESYASEQAARMSAMDKATENADELVGSLKLQFNKARQTAITTELLEIVGGAEGLK